MSGIARAQRTRPGFVLGVLALAMLAVALASPPAIAQDASPGLVSPAEFGAELPFGYKAVRYAILDAEIRVARPDLPIEVRPFPGPTPTSSVVVSPGNTADTAALKAAGASPQMSSMGGTALPTPTPGSAAVLARPEPRDIRHRLVRLIQQLQLSQAAP